MRYIQPGTQGDGFGSQLFRRLQVFSFCFFHSKKCTYIHRPFEGVTIGHMCGDFSQLDDFLGIPDNISLYPKKEIRHISIRPTFYGKEDLFLNEMFLNHIKRYYWSKPKPKSRNEITVHIRRGDVQKKESEPGRSALHKNHKRTSNNKWYNKAIPSLAKQYPDHYTIGIYSQGFFEDFSDIMHDWPLSLKERTFFNLGPITTNRENKEECSKVIDVFHQLVSSKVCLIACSHLSYVAALYSNGEIFYPNMTTSNTMLENSENYYTLYNSKPLKKWTMLS